MAIPTRRLAVNADDFGFTSGVNRGIVDAHRHGILTSTTLMANGDAFADAVQRARDCPTLDIGVHCVLVGGSSLLTGQPYPRAIPDLIRAVVAGSLRPYDELRTQIRHILDAGIRPTHLDTHKHTHLFPTVLTAVARLSNEFEIPWVRRPFDLPLSGAPAEVPLAKRAVSRALSLLRHRFHSVLSAHGCLTTDHFAGFKITGRFGPADLVHLITHLPPGTTEFMCHPGYCTSELRDAPTRLKESRQAELDALTHPSVRAALASAGVRICSFPGLLCVTAENPPDRPTPTC